MVKKPFFRCFLGKIEHSRSILFSIPWLRPSVFEAFVTDFENHKVTGFSAFMCRVCCPRTASEIRGFPTQFLAVLVAYRYRQTPQKATTLLKQVQLRKYPEPSNPIRSRLYCVLLVTGRSLCLRHCSFSLAT